MYRAPATTPAFAGEHKWICNLEPSQQHRHPGESRYLERHALAVKDSGFRRNNGLFRVQILRHFGRAQQLLDMRRLVKTVIGQEFQFGCIFHTDPGGDFFLKERSIGA